MIFVTSCDDKKESYNITGAMQKYLVERTDSTINIFIKNDEKKCYDSLAQFPAPKYAEITNEQIAYILDHDDQSLVEEQIYADCWLDGIFLKYTKIELTYILDYKNGVWSQKEINDKERSGIVWGWILFWIFLVAYFVFCAIIVLVRPIAYEKYEIVTKIFFPVILLPLIVFIDFIIENIDRFELSICFGLLGGVVLYFINWLIYGYSRDWALRKLKKKEKNT